MPSYFHILSVCVVLTISVFGYCLGITQFRTEPDGDMTWGAWEAHATATILVVAGWLGLGSLAAFFWGLARGLDWLLVATL